MTSSNQHIPRNAPCICGSGLRYKACHGKEGSKLTSSKASPTDNCYFCATDGTAYPISETTSLFVSKPESRRVVISTAAVALLESLPEYKTRAEHIDLASKALNLPQKKVGELFDELLQHRLIKPASLLIEQLKPKTSEPTNLSKFIGITLRTCERPDWLKRLLLSLVARRARFANQDPVWVLDDSRNVETQAKNQQVIKQLITQHVLEIHYLGHNWQLSFVDELIRQCADSKAESDAIRWLLSPKQAMHHTGGRLINYMTLLMAGFRYTTFDDDQLLDSARSHPSAENKIHLCSQPRWHHQAFKDYSAAVNAAQAVDFDPVQRLSELAGLSLASFLDKHPETNFSDDSLAGPHGRLTQRFRPESRVITTRSGTYGSPTYPTGISIYTTELPRDNPLWNNEKNHRYFQSGGYLWHASRRLTLSPHTVINPAGVDNSSILPPTIPDGNSHDTLTGFLTRFIYPSSLHAEFPWALGHKREFRNWSEKTLRHPHNISMSHLLYTHAIWQEPLCQATDATTRIRYLASSYRELSYRSERNLMQVIQQQQDHAITQMLSSLTKNLARTPPPPEYWQEDLQTIIDCHRERLASEMPPRLNQLPQHVTEERQTNWVREQFERFADSMDLWPKLWSYALAQAPVWHAKIRER